MTVPYKEMGLKKSAKPAELIQRMNDIKGGKMKMKKTRMKSSSMKCKTCHKMACKGCKMKKASGKKMKKSSKKA